MRVEWIDRYNPGVIENGMVPPDMWDQLDKKYQGEVIGTDRGFFGSTYLTVACEDGHIRTVNINNVKIIKHGTDTGTKESSGEV